MAVTCQLLIFFVGAKTLKQNVRNHSNILLSPSPRYGDVQVFFKVLLKFKMVATDQLHNLCGRKDSKT